VTVWDRHHPELFDERPSIFELHIKIDNGKMVYFDFDAKLLMELGRILQSTKEGYTIEVRLI
jgi:hypothetical protein